MIKKLSLILATLVLSFNANAAFIGPETKITLTTVKEVLAHPVHNKKVLLQGKITMKTGHEHYIFEDASGKITMEIDRKKISNIDITPNDLLDIEGEIEVKHRDGKTEIKVDADHVKLHR